MFNMKNAGICNPGFEGDVNLWQLMGEYPGLI